MTWPGPPALGRGVVVAERAVPDPWETAEVVVVGEDELADPGPTVVRLHHAWAARRPGAVVLHVDAARFRQPGRPPPRPLAAPGGLGVRGGSALFSRLEKHLRPPRRRPALLGGGAQGAPPR